MCLLIYQSHNLFQFSRIGAAAQLAGTVRLTYSLTAIVLEATGNLTYSFPIFVTGKGVFIDNVITYRNNQFFLLFVIVFMAKVVGDLITEGIYEIHIDLLGKIKFNEYFS